ncbi:MAG TPA: hypothetical protein VL625_09775 [Patescibacteria group bacterium]|jgi:hypothetical protein|nr:hypothetical protein [Patescibacteria group bacterium]
MRVSNRKNKTARVDFLNSDEQTEQNFRRAIIKRDYVPKTNYSGFAPEQAVGERNRKKSGDGLFKNLTVLSAAAVKAQNPANELKDNG